MKRKSTEGRKPPRQKPTKALHPEVLPREEHPKKPPQELTHQDLDDEAESELDDPEQESEQEIDDQEAYGQGGKPSETELASDNLPAVSSTDPLRRYFDEVSRYPLIDAQEEFELAMRLREKGDINAAKALVQANLRLVVKIAMEYRTMYANTLDLIQEGNIGLMKAVSKFDPTKGARLGYYASWWIRSYILKYLLDNFRLVKVGTTQAQKKLFYHLMREKERLEAQGMFAGPKLLAEKLNVREKDVVEMEQRLSSRGAELSLDAPVDSGSESKATHIDYLVDQNETADEQLARQELLKLLQERLPAFEKELNEREKNLLHARILSEEPKTLQEVADQYGLTRERARQIEAKVVAKLRDFLQKDLGP